MKKLRYFLILTCMILCVDNVVAEIVLPQIYTDNMVLQRNSTITMSGHYRKVYRHRPISTVTSHCVLALLLLVVLTQW